jgi:homoserine dehydrogenase
VKGSMIIGKGVIGSALEQMLRSKGDWAIHATCNSRTFWNAAGQSSPIASIDDIILKMSSAIEVVFLAIPTMGHGEIAFNCIVRIVKSLGLPVVLCEKAALAYNFGALMRQTDQKLRFSATVGGGCHLIEEAKLRLRRGKDTTVHAALNASLSFTCDTMMRMRASLPEALMLARENQCLDSSSATDLEALNIELHDSRLKTAILFNAAFKPKSYLSAAKIELPLFSEADLFSFANVAQDHRYCVSYSRRPIGGFANEKGEPHIRAGRFDIKHDGWFISAGFRKLGQNKTIDEWLPKGINCSIMCCQDEDGEYTLTGTGAGPMPTAGVMLDDAEQLLRSI